MKGLPAILALALAGCATSLAQNETFSIDRQRLADCIYLRLSRDVGPGLAKADIPTSSLSRITLESSGVRYWELTVLDDGPRQSRVEFAPSRNMWGSDSGGAQGVWPAVQACGQSR